ncbi:MAG: cell division/cell wall cluster transcriptional repressor MraZ [Deltaproteobacteria bacterium]
MAELFLGVSLNKVDGKGRVSIPAPFRRVLDESDPTRDPGSRARVVINYGDPRKKFLNCYSKTAFAETAREIMALPRGSRERDILTDFIIAKSHETDIEPDGRLVLPAVVREKIGLGINAEALFLGAGDTFQIWHPETHAAAEKAKHDAWLNDQPEDFDPLIYLDQNRRRDAAAGG